MEGIQPKVPKPMMPKGMPKNPTMDPAQKLKKFRSLEPKNTPAKTLPTTVPPLKKKSRPATPQESEENRRGKMQEYLKQFKDRRLT